MAKGEASTPKEKPLHDIVLGLMFEENIERPAKLSARDVFVKMPNTTVSESNVKEVLEWLVHQKRVEYSLGKYSMDRFEFLDQRRIANGEVGPDGKLKPAEFPKKDIPLHEVVLNTMFEADKESPAEFTSDELYWKISDPSVLEGQLVEVLKWLLHHNRVEYKSGKYSLDSLEFVEQTEVKKATEKVEKPKKNSKSASQKTPVAKKAPKEAKPPKQTQVKEKKEVRTPKVKETTSIPKVEPAKPVSVPKKDEIKIESAPEPKAKVIREEVSQTVEKSPVVDRILLSVCAVLFIYTFYILISASGGMTAETSNQVQDEIVSAELRLSELSNTKEINPNRLEIVEEKLNLVQEISTKKSEQIANQNRSNDNWLRSLTVRLLLPNTLILVIFGVVYYRRESSSSNKNSKN